MFGFMDGQELSLLPKVDKPIRQTKGKATMGNHVEKFIKEKTLKLVVDNEKPFEITLGSAFNTPGRSITKKQFTKNDGFNRYYALGSFYICNKYSMAGK